MNDRFNQIQAGWTVAGSDGGKVGDIEEVGPDYLLVTKGLIFKTDLYVPHDAIAEVDPADGRVILSVPKDEVENMGWTEPPSAVDVRADMGRSERGGTADEPVEGLGYTGRDTATPDADLYGTPVGAGIGAETYGATGSRDDIADPAVSGMEPGGVEDEPRDRDRGPGTETAGAGTGALGGAALGGAVGGPPGAVAGGIVGAAGGAAAGGAADDGTADDDLLRERMGNQHRDF